MQPLPTTLQHTSRSLTYPLVVAAVRLVGVAQAIALPFGAALPQWLVFTLFGYAAVATALAWPPRSRPTAATEEKIAVRPAAYAMLVALDIAVAAIVASKSGPSALAMLPGFDA